MSTGRNKERTIYRSFVYIIDPEDKLLYLLVPDRKIAYRMPLEFVKNAATSPPGPPRFERLPPNSSIGKEMLGKKWFGPVEGEGVRTTLEMRETRNGKELAGTEVLEEWRSPKLPGVVLQSYIKGSTTENFTEVVTLSNINPSPDLFRPPAGYVVEDRSGTFFFEFGIWPAGATPPLPPVAPAK